MGVDPDDAGLGEDLEGAGGGAQADGVVATERQGKVALLQLGSDAAVDLLGDPPDEAGVLGDAIVGVGLGAELLKVVDLAVELHLPAELLELGQQAGVQQLLGALLDSLLGLPGQLGSLSRLPVLR